MKFIKEEPAKEDLFSSQAHTLVSQNVYNSIYEEDVFVVGLEGDLGSGKSTILNNVKNLSENDGDKPLVFIDFDTELYHNNNVNKALVNILYDELSVLEPLKASDKSKQLKNIKDRALGNVVDYERTVTSNLSWWMVTFVMVALCSIEMIGDGAKAIGESWRAISSGTIKFSPTGFVQVLFLFAPLIWFAVWGLFRYFCDKNSSRYPPDFVDIFKRQAPERIDEVLEVPNEVGSYELKNALSQFNQMIPDDTLVVLVIDNLDRVPESSLPQVWADLEVFTQVNSEKLKLIIPHSTKHVARAISENNDPIAGMEFISKRIPIKHRVPPLVQSDWRGVLKLFAEQAELKLDDDELLVISNIIQLWVPESIQQITPRYLKKQINEIVSILLSRSDISPAVACAHANMTLYGQLTHEQLITDGLDDEHTMHRPHSRTYIQLAKLNLTKEQIKSQFVEVHFQADGEIANSELLMSQLELYLSKSDYDKFIDQDKFGYDPVLRNFLPEAERLYLIDLLLELSVLNEPRHKRWFDSYLKLTANEIDKLDINDITSSTKGIKSLYQLLANLTSIKANFNEQEIHDEFFILISLKIRSYLAELLQSEFDTKLHTIELYVALQGACALANTALDERLLNMNPEAFVNVAWPNKEKLQEWSGDFELELNEKVEIHDVIRNFEHYPSEKELAIYRYLKNSARVGRAVIGSEGFNPITDSHTSFSYSDINEYGDDYIDLYYFSEIFNECTLSIDYQQINNVSEEYRDKAVSLFITNQINNDSSNAKSHLVSHLPHMTYNEDNCKKLLVSDLSMVSHFQKIVNALNDERLKEVIGDSVKQLICKGNVGALNTSNLYTSNYSILSSLYESDKSTLLQWMNNGWSVSKLSSLDSVSIDFLRDVVESEFDDINKKLIAFYDDKYDKTDWEHVIASPVERDYLEAKSYMGAKLKRPKGANITNAFKKLVKDGKLDIAEVEFFKLLYKTLPVKSVNTLGESVNTMFYDENIPLDSKEFIVEFIRDIDGESLMLDGQLSQAQQLALCNFVNSCDPTTAEWIGANLKSLIGWSDENKNKLQTTLEGNEILDSFNLIKKELPEVLESTETLETT